MLIDVERECLIAGSTRLRYVALSYVWGGAPGFQTTYSNIEQLLQPHALQHQPDLPLLIRDAINLTRKVDERYLWVDRLCIQQDNPLQKHTQVGKMDIIYRPAAFTLVAISCSNASESRPGTRNGSLRRAVRTENICGISLTAFPTPGAILESNVYKTRGWTFQERLLSPRCLYLTEFGAIYHCHESQALISFLLVPFWSPDVSSCCFNLLRASIPELRVKHA